MDSPEGAALSTQPPGWRAWLLSRLAPSENGALIAISLAVGLACGLAAVGLHELIELSRRLILETPWPADGPLVRALRTIAAPALGALAVGTALSVFARHDRGHGTSAVMEAVALRGGRLSAPPIVSKVIGAGLLIGSGNSAGPEDPSVQIGAVIGSVTGQRLRLSDTRVRTLVTAGVASAIAAAFNAPIAGVFFALEVVAGEFSTTLFAPVVLASVIASVVSRAILGAEPAFQVPQYAVIDPLLEIPLYALLGLFAAVVGALFIAAVFASEDAFQRLKLPTPLRAMAGGLLVGLIALGVPGVMGVGYEVTTSILNGQGPLGALLVLLLVAKFAATAITLGAVGVGGTFAPSLVLGAAAGGIFGQGVAMLFPGATAPPAAYALVGMGAVLAAVVRAPITAVLLLFEVTGDYTIILPIMASVVVSTLFAHRLHPESIYTERLLRKGIQLRFGRDVNILEVVTVGEVMTREPETVRPDLSIAELEALFERTHHHGFPVVDAAGRLVGMVTLADLRFATEKGFTSSACLEAIMTRDLVVAHPDQSLNEALRRLGEIDVGRLPVVDRARPERLLGILRRSDIIRAYNRGAMRRAELDHRLQQMRAGSHAGSHLIELEIPAGSRADGRAVRELQLPPQAIISSIRRRGRAIIPRGDTVLAAGDHLTILAAAELVDEAKKRFLEGGGGETGPRYRELTVSAASPAAGRQVAELQLPQGVLIVSLRRTGQVHTVNGKTRLEPGDELTLLAPLEALTAAEATLIGP